MRPAHPALLLPLLVLLFASPVDLATAQERVIEPRRGTRGEVVRAATSDPALAPRSRDAERARVDADAGIVRARYRIDDAEPAAAAPAEAALRYLTAHRAFGIARDRGDLRVERETSTSRSRHVEFRQTLQGYAVFGGSVKVNLDAEGRPTMVLNNYRPHVAGARLPRPTLDADAAAQAVADRAGDAITVVGEPELVVYPSEVPRLAWHVIARPSDDSAEWSILLDTVDGTVILWMDQSVHSGGTGIRGTDIRGTGIRGTASRGTGIRGTASRGTAIAVDGSGSVFDPDPLTTAGVAYGPPFVDANDADVPELNAQRKSVVLREISRGNDGLYRLEGPYVRIVSGDVIGAAYTPPAVSSPEGFHFTRSSDFFEAVNAYYHIDRSQRYIQQVDPELDVHRFPIRVNPHGMGTADNSQYRPASNALLFGTGGIDDAEDAHVIWHEYAHALLQASTPGLLNTVEGQALHEGWADYWAVSYTRELIESGAVPPRDWRKVFTWDGNETWNGRRLEHSGTYPDDAPCSQSTACDIWQDGRLWATTLMEIYPHVGRRVMDHLNLLSHAYLTAPATMRDAAEAIIQADLDHYDGAHLSVLLEVFRRRGFVGGSDFGPLIAHDPPASTEDVSGALTFEAEVTSDVADVRSVHVVIVSSDGAEERFELTHMQGDLYQGDVALPGIAGELCYYIEAEDDAGQRVVYPGSAPKTLLTVIIGPDEEPPIIAHDPPGQVNEADWPVRLTANVTDRMGIDAVWVEYRVVRNGEEEVGQFHLSAVADYFEGRFPDLDVEPGRPVRYRVIARDASRAANEATVPEEGEFTIDITGGSVVRYYSFDGSTNEGIQAGGAWQRGRPVFGTQVTPSEPSAWGIILDGSYPDQRSLSSLILPPITLIGHPQAYLVFWHWYDTEHDGRAYPENPNPATIWDGGNVKISGDDGATWQVITPADGYAGMISDRHDNPLGGEPGFGGYSRGWRRVVVPLPEYDDALIRFDFGTDAGNVENAVQFAGWYIDDVEIRLDLDADTSVPTFVALPDAQRASGAEDPPLRIEARAEDDTGIEAVRMHYQLFDGDGGLIERDTVSFDMSATDPTLFVLDFRPAQAVEPSYHVEYHLSARDFDGNETWSTSGGAGYRIDYLHHERVALLDAPRHTGLWTYADNRWITARRLDTVLRSSLLMGPLDLPTGASTLEVHLEHQYELGEGIGGNTKISADDGRTWTVLEPMDGYDGTFPTSEGHDMAGQPVFTGSERGPVTSVFDVTDFGGRQIRIRLDYGAVRPAAENEWWSVQNAELRIVAADDDLPVPRELSLHANFPDPFSTTTTIGYTLPEQDIILLELYDILGRRIDVIRYALQPAGTYSFTYDGSRLASGVYLVSMIVGQERRVEQMVIAK